MSGYFASPMVKSELYTVEIKDEGGIKGDERMLVYFAPGRVTGL